MKTMICQPAIDYLTATSFDNGFREAVRKTVLPKLRKEFKLKKSPDQAKVLQYKGIRYLDSELKEVAFLGIGEQLTKIEDNELSALPHYMLRVSGLAADHVYRELLKQEVQFTPSRVDVQLTMPPEQKPSRELWIDFNEGQFRLEMPRKNKARNVLLITDNETGHTLYVGSRKSTKLIRCYQKTAQVFAKQKPAANEVRAKVERSEATLTFAEGERDPELAQTKFVQPLEEQLVRLEVELKTTGAKAFDSEVKERGIDKAMVKLLKSVKNGLYSTPLLTEHVDFLDKLPESGEWSESRLVTLSNKTLLWWIKVCASCAERLLEDPDTRDQLIEEVHKLMDLIERSKARTKFEHLLAAERRYAERS